MSEKFIGTIEVRSEEPLGWWLFWNYGMGEISSYLISFLGNEVEFPECFE